MPAGDLDRQDRTATSDARRGPWHRICAVVGGASLAFDPVLGLTGDGVAVAAIFETSLARQMITPMPFQVRNMWTIRPHRSFASFQ